MGIVQVKMLLWQVKKNVKLEDMMICIVVFHNTVT